jgi:HSP20 family molecular chaperone IbpA
VTADFCTEASEYTLTIVAERRKVAPDKTPTSERRLERRFTWPARVDPTRVEATYRNGVLEVGLARAEPVK